MLRGAFALLLALTWSAPAWGQSVSLSVTNQSLCFTSDDDNDQGNPVPYDPGDDDCNETGLVDINVFKVTHATSGSGSEAATLFIDAGVVVDANPSSTEYQAGRISYALQLDIAGTGGAGWELTVDQQILGLLATESDGDGSANAGATGVTATLDVGPALDFDSFVSRSAGSSGSQEFSASRLGDVLQGSGDTTLLGNVEITLDAYSACGGFLCLGNADEGAVLFGFDDASGSTFASVDEYASWGRAVGPDGYTATFRLDVDPYCGDGSVDPGLGEECDDGNNESGDGCSAGCVTEFCGDGSLQPGLGERCDDGNTSAGDGCSASCQPEIEELPALSRRGTAALCIALAALGALGLALSRRRAR